MRDVDPYEISMSEGIVLGNGIETNERHTLLLAMTESSSVRNLWLSSSWTSFTVSSSAFLALITNTTFFNYWVRTRRVDQGVLLSE